MTTEDGRVALDGAVSSIVQLRGDQWAHPPYRIGWLIFGVLALAGFHGEAPVARCWPPRCSGCRPPPATVEP